MYLKILVKSALFFEKVINILKPFRSQGESEMVDELNKKIEKFLTDNSATPDQVKYLSIIVLKFSFKGKKCGHYSFD